MVAIAALALALARPQWPGQAVPAKQLGLDLVIALDFSRSMLAKDVYPSRLERAKREIGELLDLFAGDRVGIVAFAGETLTYPPTTDYDAVKLFWRDLNPWDMPVGGTAIGRAIRASLDQLVPLRAKEATAGAQRGQAILLLTDGEDTDSEPLAAADEASKLGVKIFTVGVGSRSGELIPEYDDKGKVTGYVKDAEGKYVTSRLAEDTLARDREADGRRAVPRRRQALRRRGRGARAGVAEADRKRRAAGAALRRAVPAAGARRAGHPVRGSGDRRAPAAAQGGVGVTARGLWLVALAPLLSGAGLFQSRNAEVEKGNAAMAAGKAEDALAHYDKAVAKLPAEAGVHFDRGAALYALSRFDEAAQEFLRATDSADAALKAEAFRGLGNAHFKKEKFKDAVEAYKRALALRPDDQAAKRNLEIALLKKKEEEKKEQEKQGQGQGRQRQAGRQGQEGRPGQAGRQGQGQAGQEGQAGQGQARTRRTTRSRARTTRTRKTSRSQQQPKPAGEDKAQQLEALLKNLEGNPKDLEKERARLRAVRRGRPARDW